MAEVAFRKSGREIKEAISKKIVGLQQRLEKRNENLDRFLDDRKKVRSFVVRSGLMQVSEHYRGGGMALYPKGDISSEEIEEILQLCRRIYEIEQEVYRLTMIKAHLADKDVFDISLVDLVGYGFEA